MFAAAIPQPVHSLPGGLLATSIRDALTLSSFRAYMSASCPPVVRITSGQNRDKVKRTRKRKARPRRSIALDAMRAIRINELSRRAVQQVNGRRVKLTPEEVAEGARLLAEVMGPVLKMTKRRGWVHIPARDWE